MNSAFLYLAIIVMWLGVLVPMWLRRDKHDLMDLQEPEPGTDSVYPPYPVTGTDETTGPITIPPIPASDTPDSEAAETTEEHSVVPQPIDHAALRRRAEARRRSIIIARRRRRLFWCVLLVMASVVTAAVEVIPWWGVAPSGLLMVGYLAVLRVAVKMDRERKRLAAEARAERARRRRERRRALELAARQQEAEVIEFSTHQTEEIFDQYAEPERRAVGD